MALVRGTTTLYKVASSADTSVPVVLADTGLNKLAVVVVRGRGGSVVVGTDITLDGLSCNDFQVNNFDAGGVAAYGASGYFTNAQHPGGGSVTLAFVVPSGVNNLIFEVIEYTGALQINSRSAETQVHDNDIVEAGLVDIVLGNQSGEAAVIYCSSSDSVLASGSGGHTVDADATMLDQDFDDRNRSAFAEDAVVAASSVTYTWTLSHDGAANMDNVVLGAFAVFAAPEVPHIEPLPQRNIRHSGVYH